MPAATKSSTRQETHSVAGAPVQKAPPKPVTPKRSLPSTSIQSFLKSGKSAEKLKAAQPEEDTMLVVNDSGTGQREPFNQTDLQGYWTGFARPIEKGNPRLFSMLTAQSPRVKEGHIIVFPLSNETQESELMKVKSQLLNYLRQSLKNDTLLLEVEYLKEEETKENYIFTNTDRMKAMVEKNPALGKLKEKLRLDLE